MNVSICRNILFLICVFKITGCSFNAPKQSEGALFLQGSWMQDSVNNQSQLVNYQSYQIRFIKDSFYLKINNFSRVNIQGGTCYNKTTWLEFAKGHYSLHQDTLKFNGNFVNKDFKYKPEGTCYRNGKFQEQFIIKKHTEIYLDMKSLATNLKHHLQKSDR